MTNLSIINYKTSKYSGLKTSIFHKAGVLGLLYQLDHIREPDFSHLLLFYHHRPQSTMCESSSHWEKRKRKKGILHMSFEGDELEFDHIISVCISLHKAEYQVSSNENREHSVYLDGLIAPSSHNIVHSFLTQ